VEVCHIYRRYVTQIRDEGDINNYMASILKKYEDAARAQGIVNHNTDEAIDWFIDVVNNLTINRKKLLNDSAVKTRSRFLPGKMYAFVYDPKTKKTLPFYDRFPLVVLVDKAEGGGFYGLNLHYLTPFLRAKLLSALVERTQGSGESKRFKLTYNMLNSLFIVIT